MSKKEKIDQGSHTDKKKSVKPVESEVTKELIEGDEITKALSEQQREQAEAKMIEEAKASKGAQFEARIGEPDYTKAQFQALIDAYAKSNPVKYAMKKKALEAKLNSL